MTTLEERLREFGHHFVGKPLLAVKLIEAGFAILDVIDNTCHACWDGERDCQCWNDE